MRVLLFLLSVAGPPDVALPPRAAQPEPREPSREAAREEARAGAARLLGIALAGEPRIEQVQRAAAERAGPSTDDAASLRRRSRLEALVPRLVAEYRHDERSYRVVGLTSGSEVDYLREAPGDTATARLDWDLRGLVFGRQELGAVAAAERAAAARRKVVERATQLYYERLERKVALTAAPPEDRVERARAELALATVTAELEALTGLYGEAAR